MDKFKNHDKKQIFSKGSLPSKKNPIPMPTVKEPKSK